MWRRAGRKYVPENANTSSILLIVPNTNVGRRDVPKISTKSNIFENDRFVDMRIRAGIGIEGEETRIEGTARSRVRAFKDEM